MLTSPDFKERLSTLAEFRPSPQVDSVGRLCYPDAAKEEPQLGSCAMKRVELPLSRLSIAQKLDLTEALWAVLPRGESKFESPAWHKAVLEDREKAFKAGTVTRSDWEQAKKRIRASLNVSDRWRAWPILRN